MLFAEHCPSTVHPISSGARYFRPTPMTLSGDDQPDCSFSFSFPGSSTSCFPKWPNNEVNPLEDVEHHVWNTINGFHDVCGSESLTQKLLYSAASIVYVTPAMPAYVMQRTTFPTQFSHCFLFRLLLILTVANGEIFLLSAHTRDPKDMLVTSQALCTPR